MLREKAPEKYIEVEPEVLGRQLLRTYYISFALSQGLVSPQLKMLDLSAAHYQSMYGREAASDASDTVSSDFIQNLKVPNSHKAVDLGSYQSNEFRNRWVDFKKQLSRRHSAYNPESKTYQTKLASMLGDIAVRDLDYLSPRSEGADLSMPGKGRSNKKDPYKSFFRENVLASTSTGDPNALDPILSDASNLLSPHNKLYTSSKYQIRSLQNNTMPRLAYAWENCHPEQDFADPEHITDAVNLRSAQLASDLTK